MQSKWFNRWKDAKNSKLRIYCFLHAGAGTAALKDFAIASPNWIDVVAVRLPGRENRFLEDLPESIEEVAKEVAIEIKKECNSHNIPILLMGQCSGALLALETAINLDTDIQLQGIVLCSRPSPDIELEEINLNVPDQIFIDEVIKIGGINPEILKEQMLLEICYQS